MSFKKWLLALVALLLCMPAALAASIADYGRLPTLSDVTLSPDGKTLAYIGGTDEKRLVAIQSIEAKGPPVLLNFNKMKLRSLHWAGSNYLIILTSQTTLLQNAVGERHEYWSGQYYDLKTKALRPLIGEHVKGLEDTDYSINVVAGDPEFRSIDGHPYIFVPSLYFPLGSDYLNSARNVAAMGLVRVDLETGEDRLVSRKSSQDAQDWLLDESGNILAEEDLTRYTQHWQLVLYRDGQPDKPVLDIPSPIEAPGIAGLTEDGSAVLIQMPPTVDGVTFQQVSLKDGSATPWRRGLQTNGVFTEERTGRVIGAAHSMEKADYIFFDPRLDAMWKGIKTAFASATNVRLDSWSDDKTRAVLHVFGPSVGEGYFLIDMTAKKATPIGPAYDGIKEFYPETWIDYPAADGRVIHAYLTMPLGRGAKNLPLIVLPHGGPHARDNPGFDWISQSLASRGYVVLQPEFRGSDGLGRELLEACFGEYGKKMQTDLSDGARALAAQGLIDPGRVCIVGASYGGYAALAGATLDTGVYRCAVAIAGLSDMKDMMKDWPRPSMGPNGMRFWDRFLGVTKANLSPLDAISPIRHIDKVTIPILLIHGRDDTVVPFSQSENMADALKAANKPYEFVTLTAEDHWLSSGATRLQMLEATVKFLETYNPPN